MLVFFIVAVVTFMMFIAGKEDSRGTKFILIVLLVIYITGSVVLNNNVREASSHGNTKHGWYSKENGFEKFLTKAWVYGYPVVVLIVGGFLLARKDDE